MDRPYHKYGRLEKQQKRIKTNINKMTEVTTNKYNKKQMVGLFSNISMTWKQMLKFLQGQKNFIDKTFHYLRKKHVHNITD